MLNSLCADTLEDEFAEPVETADALVEEIDTADAVADLEPDALGLATTVVPEAGGEGLLDGAVLSPKRTREVEVAANEDEEEEEGASKRAKLEDDIELIG